MGTDWRQQGSGAGPAPRPSDRARGGLSTPARRTPSTGNPSVANAHRKFSHAGPLHVHSNLAATAALGILLLTKLKRFNSQARGGGKCFNSEAKAQDRQTQDLILGQKQARASAGAQKVPGPDFVVAGPRSLALSCASSHSHPPPGSVRSEQGPRSEGTVIRANTTGGRGDPTSRLHPDL